MAPSSMRAASTDELPAVDSFVVPSLHQLSIGEIRTRLSALGESTITPGVTGEERRTALMRRLIDAVCMSTEDSNISSIASTIVAETLKPTKVVEKVESPIKLARPVSPIVPSVVHVKIESPPPVSEPEEVVTAATISTLKNDLKRLVNQRAMAVASKLSGNLQDEQLKECEAKLARIETEATQFKTLLQKGETKLATETVQSNFLVLNPAVTSYAIEALLSRLDGYRSSAKDKIREHRLRIREEGDDHPKFGVAAEEKLKIQLSEANLASTKSGKVVTSRARQKLAEVKDLETQLQQEGRVASVPDSPTKPTIPFKVEPSGTAAPPNRAPPDRSPKDKPPVHNTSNKIQSGVAPRAVLPTSPDAQPEKPRLDKWSTELAPTIATAPIRVEKPTKVDILASKLPNFTSSFLGKAIDLDARSLSSKSEDKSNKITPGVDVAKPVPVASLLVTRPESKPVPPVSVVPNPVAPLPSVDVAARVAKSGSIEVISRPAVPLVPDTVGSVKLSSAPAPVIPGRRPPPLPAGSVSQKPPGADLGPFPQGASAFSDVQAAEDEAFEFYGEEFNDNHDEYFREVSEAASRKNQAAPRNEVVYGEKVIQSSLSEEGVERQRSLPARQFNQHLSASNDSELDDTHESAGAYVPEDGDDLDNDSDDYDRLYGTRRMDTEQDDDDLEELPGSRSSRTPMRTHSNSSFGEGNRLEPLPEVPLDSRSGSRSNSRSGSRTSSRGESRSEHHTDAISPGGHPEPPLASHLPPIEESDMTPPSTKIEQRKSFVHRNPNNSPRIEAKLNHSAENRDATENSDNLDYTPPASAQRSKKPIYDLAGNLDVSEEEVRGVPIFDETSDGEEERLGDEKIQIKVLRSHAKVLEGLNDVAAAEAVHMRALELDPTNISTLEGFALFLHQKKGELARAEAFFNRGLQVCLPGLVLKTGGSATNTPQSGKKSVTQMSFTTDGTMQGAKVTHIIKFILSYAHFLSKAKGDLEAASILYKKGVDLAPDNALLLATYAHFLAQVGDHESNTAAAEYFQRALKISPGSGQYAMWYGKLLKKTGKIGQAELMYKVALEQSKGNDAIEATAMCNYATFVFKQRKDPERASVLFKAGLGSYPQHKGLRKNYAVLIKSHPQYATEDLAPTKKDSRSATDRAQRLAQHAMESITEPLATTAEEDVESDHPQD